jgi:hypothetical protein
MYTTYALVDPRDRRIFYVGCTSLNPKVRYSSHLSAASTGRGIGSCADYIRTLLALGYRPTMFALDRTHKACDARESELHFITVIPYLTNSPKGTRSSCGKAEPRALVTELVSELAEALLDDWRRWRLRKNE